MRFDPLLLSILQWTLCAPPVVAFPSWSHLSRHATDHPSAALLSFTHLGHNRRPWRRLSDRIIQAVWQLPDSHSSAGASLDTLTKPGKVKKSSRRASARYGGDIVLRFNLTTAEDAKALSEAANILFLDVWEFNDDWVDIRMARDVVPSLLGLLPSTLQHAHKPLMHDLDLYQAILNSSPSPSATESSPQRLPEYRSFSASLQTPVREQTNLFFSDYQPLSVIVPWMRLMQSLFPTHVRMISIGLSYEGREIYALKVGVHPTNNERPTPRKTIVITGGLHAREWIATSSVNYIAYSFITSYGKDNGITKLIEHFDWVFIPTSNPDGYVYTWESDRLWRKSRQQTSLRFCRGIDLDHAWGFQWDGSFTEGNPCSESFAGDTAFEAVEARQLANWALSETAQNSVSFVGYMDLHSYSQQVLYPYSYSCDVRSPALEDLEELALGVAKVIRHTSGHIYRVASACDGNVAVNAPAGRRAAFPRVETGGGSALDWFHHELRVRYALQVKLPDNGNYGFLLPKEHIVPTGKETLSAVQFFGGFLARGMGIGGVREHFNESSPTEQNPHSEEVSASDAQDAIDEDNEEDEFDSLELADEEEEDDDDKELSVEL